MDNQNATPRQQEANYRHKRLLWEEQLRYMKLKIARDGPTPARLTELARLQAQV